MKTKEILDKYKQIISSILKCNKEEIKFYNLKIINKNTNKERQEFVEVGEVYYYKPDVEGCTKETNMCDFQLGEYIVEQVLKENKKRISSWKLYQLPHCCAYMVSCNVSVSEDYRNKKIGTVLNQLRQDLGRILGYSAVLCTDIEKNTNQRKLLATNGWKDIHNIINKRTQNRVYLSVINL